MKTKLENSVVRRGGKTANRWYEEIHDIYFTSNKAGSLVFDFVIPSKGGGETQIQLEVGGGDVNKFIRKPRRKEPLFVSDSDQPSFILLEDYEKDGVVKSFLVRGNTKPIKGLLRELGGRWNHACNGWFFSQKKKSDVFQALSDEGITPLLSPIVKKSGAPL